MFKGKKELLLILIIIISVFSLSGCGGEKEQSGSKELEKLVIGVASTPENLDPAYQVGNRNIRINYNIFDTLILSDQLDNSALKPMLAKSWERIDDLSLKIVLRDDVKFHNGDPLTAKDVAFSFERLKSADAQYSLAKSLLGIISDIEVVDDYTVIIKTSTIDPIVEHRLASNFGAWIVPKNYIESVGLETFGSKPIGTGPYKVQSFSPDKVVLERFEDYWGEKPVAKIIEYRNIPESSARITAIVNGEIDILVQLPPDQESVIEKYEDLTIVGQNITNMHMLVYNTGAGPLKDKKLRQALSLAIDRQLLSDTLWKGKAIVPKGHQYPQFGEYYFDDYPVMEYNLEKAKQLVKESSYNGEVIEYELRSGYYTFGNEVAEVIVDMWSKIGVKGQVLFKEKSEYKMVRNWSNTMRFPDPSGGLWLLWGPESGRQKKTWKDASDEFNKTGTEMESIMDPVRRKELARKLMDLWIEEAPGTALYYPYESWVIRKGINWTPYASQAMDFRANNFSIE